MPQGITRVSIEGFDQVIKNLNIEILLIEDQTRKGLTEVAAFLFNDMNTVEPLIPQLFNILIPSWRTHMITNELGQHVIGMRMGFSANYALWVHEMYGAVNWTRPGSGPGFFIQSLNRNHDTILNIIQSETKIP